jgi:hypothetical protein
MTLGDWWLERLSRGLPFDAEQAQESSCQNPNTDPQACQRGCKPRCYGPIGSASCERSAPDPSHVDDPQYRGGCGVISAGPVQIQVFARVTKPYCTGAYNTMDVEIKFSKGSKWGLKGGFEGKIKGVEVGGGIFYEEESTVEQGRGYSVGRCTCVSLKQCVTVKTREFLVECRDPDWSRQPVSGIRFPVTATTELNAPEINIPCDPRCNDNRMVSVPGCR